MTFRRSLHLHSIRCRRRRSLSVVARFCSSWRCFVVTSSSSPSSPLLLLLLLCSCAPVLAVLQSVCSCCLLVVLGFRLFGLLACCDELHVVDCVRRCVRCGVARLLFRVYTLVSVASGSVVWLVLKCLRLTGCCWSHPQRLPRKNSRWKRQAEILWSKLLSIFGLTNRWITQPASFHASEARSA